MPTEHATATVTVTGDDHGSTGTVTINEIFLSIQGESTHAGRPCLFLRTTGCPLRCRWCDTEYAFHEGERHSVQQLVDLAAGHDVDLVEITGGEPLVQPAVPVLARELLRIGKTVLVETSGALDISVLPAGVIRIVDMKCPGSGEVDANDYDNLDRLTPEDEVKLVVADRQDYEWGRALVRQHRLCERVAVLMSPVWGQLAPQELAAWILEDRLEVRLQLQLHKILWPDVVRGV